MNIEKYIKIANWMFATAIIEIVLLLCAGFALLIKGANDESTKLIIIGSLSMLFGLGMANFLLIFSIGESLRDKRESKA